jgi:DNA polymerase-3 subunit gamma/tau
MAYQTLYLKYRSQRFGELVGQDAIAQTLKNAVEQGRVAHAYLFSGVRGTGKTSTARILARAINCLHRQGAEPDGVCANCVEIASGAAVDLIEIDAASNRGIDEIRDLRERVKYLPAVLKVKVYIIDEAHMLTTEAFNALLKTLEEPPAHVVFVLATTEPHKIPLTVASRCQRFDFRRIETGAIAERLAFIVQQEGVQVDPQSLALLARLARGSMRDGITLLDQLISQGGEGLTIQRTHELLGLADPDTLVRLLGFVAAMSASWCARCWARSERPRYCRSDTRIPRDWAARRRRHWRRSAGPPGGMRCWPYGRA